MTVNPVGVEEIPYADGILVYRQHGVTLANISALQSSAYDDMMKAAKGGSSCSRRQVAAIAIGPDGHMISVGYNDVLIDEICERCPLSYDQVALGADYTIPGQRCPAAHAEETCLITSGASELRPSLMFISEEPCDRCADLLHRFGIPWWVRSGVPTVKKETPS